MYVLDFDYISKLNVSPQQIYDWCSEVWKIKSKCVLPAKTKMWQGSSGRYITMPCVIPDEDIAGVKFISRNIESLNDVPARNSNIMIQQCSKMGLLAVVDGIWITNMRTGAIAAHSVLTYSKSNFKTIGMIGLGLAAWSFMYIFGNVYRLPLMVKLFKYKDQAEKFIDRFAKFFPHLNFEIVDSVEEVCSCDTVVSAISYAHENLCDDSVFNPGCLIVPIHTAGFQNCDQTFDRFVIDDHEHVKGFKYYDSFKQKAVEMGDVENNLCAGRNNDEERIIAYCGGIALHDIYIAHKIYEIALQRKDVPEVKMHFPNKHLWV